MGAKMGTMTVGPVSSTLETHRLLLRPRRAEEAGIYRELWAERDPRVPPHRRIDGEGRPTEGDIARSILREQREERPGLLAVRRQRAGT